MGSFRRPLKDPELVHSFLTNALGAEDYLNSIGADLVGRVLEAEDGIDRYEIAGQTLDSNLLRNEAYVSEADRWQLRQVIVDELSQWQRLKNDNNIRLGAGGALPVTELQAAKTAFLIIGPPAAGKSTLSNQLSDEWGAVIVDSDYAKRKLPEYYENPFGATIVNEESGAIVQGFDDREDFLDLLSFCVINNYNLVAPVVGGKPRKVLGLADALKENGYTVNLLLVSASRKLATFRALQRFYETGRYVPPAYVFDEVGNDPAYCYYYLRSKAYAQFDSYGAVILDGGTYFCIDRTAGSPAAAFEERNITNELP